MNGTTIQRAMAGVMVGLMAVAALVFPGLVGFRCEAMETVHDRPCCPHVSLHGWGEARLAKACCAFELREAAPALSADSLASAFAAPLPAPVPSFAPIFGEDGSGLLPAGARADPPPGPPLRLRDCSLLI